jgi:uncharacterized protein (DUF1786 family)
MEEIPMARFLLIDIGAGTMDVLCFDDESGEHLKAVARSPVRTLAEEAAALPGDLLVAGKEMGGGPVSKILAERAREHRVVMTASAAATIHHDLDKVRSLGIEIIPDVEARGPAETSTFSKLELHDLEIQRTRGIVERLGVPFAFDFVGICAQDHGVAPPGRSHLDYRHEMFTRRLDVTPYPHTLLYRSDEIPPTLNRLRSIASDAAALPAREVYVMDSGMAAILGASLDRNARGKRRVLVLDIATSHTVGAALDQGEIAAFFEYHTRDLTLPRLEALIRDVADGRLEHGKILGEGGHGAYTRKILGFDNIECIVATGPKRILVEGSSLPIVYGAPLGDNMMTGTSGLLEAIRRRKGLSTVPNL